MKKALFLLLLLPFLAAGVLFTGVGQEKVLLPAANWILSDKIPGHRLKLKELRPGWNTLYLVGTIDGSIRFQAKGPANWWKRRFRLQYEILADSIENRGVRHRLDLRVTGEAVGDPTSMKVEGMGRAFAAPLHFRFALNEGKLEGLDLTLDGARLRQILALADLPPYASGSLKLQVAMPRFDPDRPEGELRFHLARGRLNAALLAKEGIVVPKGSPLKAEGYLEADGKLLKGEGSFESSFARLDLERVRSDAALRIVKSGYRIDVKKLEEIQGITPVPMQGRLVTSGEFYFDRIKKLLQLKGSSDSLGGKLAYLYDGTGLRVDLSKVEAPRVLGILLQPPYLSQGLLDGRIRLEDPKRLLGDFDLALAGAWDRAAFPPASAAGRALAGKFRLKLLGELKGDRVLTRADYRSVPFDLDLRKGRYLLLAKSFEAEYRLKSPDLSRLSAQAVKGPFQAQGKLQYLGIKKRLVLEGFSRSFGGKTHWKLDGDTLKLTMKELDPTGILRRLSQPVLFQKGRLDGELNLRSLAKSRGTFHYKLHGQVDRKAWKRSLDVDPGKGLMIDATGKGALAGDRVTLESRIKSGLEELNLRKVRYRLSQRELLGRYELKIPELGRLKSLLGKSYRGSFRTTGEFRYDGKLWYVRGKGSQWGGAFAYTLDGERLKAEASGLRIERLLSTLRAPAYLEGNLDALLRYDLGKRVGTLGAKGKGLRLKSSPLTQAASLILKTDLSRELFQEAILRSGIKGDQVIFDLDAHSPKIRLAVKKGHFDRARQRIDAVVNLWKKEKHYKIQIKGPLNRPQVIPILTDALEKKIQHEIKKHDLEKKIPKELRKVAPVEELIRSIF